MWLFSNWTVIALFSVPCSITWYNNSKTIKMFFHYCRTGVNSFVGPVLKTSFVVNKGLLMHSFLLWCKLLGLVNSPKSFKLLLHLNGFSMSKMSFCWASVSGKYFWNWDFFWPKKKIWYYFIGHSCQNVASAIQNVIQTSFHFEWQNLFRWMPRHHLKIKSSNQNNLAY